jgi:multiple sugar transport system permease protein
MATLTAALETHRKRTWLSKLLRYETMAETRECLWGFLFATPWLLGLLIFTIGPILASMYLSFTKYDVISTPQFLGLENYARAFTGDELFWPSMGRTFRYALSVVPLSIIGSLALAMLLNQGYRGTNVFRTLYFLPHLTPAVAMAYLWRWLLQPSVGPVNFVLKGIGMQNPPGWLSDPKTALNSLAMIALWGSMGGNNMLIFLAGLQGVPQELYDAADVDGASRWRRFWAVTLPMISPALFFNLVMGIIGALKAFAMAFVSTQGGPSRATWFYALHLYTIGFQYFEMGYAAALAWIFAVVIILITLIQFRLSSRWVYYAGA